VTSIERRRARNWIAVGALAAFIGVGVIAYPYLLVRATSRFGVSGLAAALLIVVAISVALRGISWIGALRGGAAASARVPIPPAAAAASAGIPLLLAAAATTGDARYLQLVPSAVYFGMAGWFFASLRTPVSVIERAARFLVPEAPEFIRPYCRKLTGVWAFFFAASALAIAGLALAGAGSAWAFFTGKLIYALMLAGSLAEFLFRKTWFRYYFHRGWFDRLWARIFPAENTAEGRRSMAHIAEYWRHKNRLLSRDSKP
jgi:uncharacterized membrane protein